MSNHWCLCVFVLCFTYVNCVEQSESQQLEHKIRNGMATSNGSVTSSRPNLADVVLDCKVKNLAFDFAKQIHGNSSWLKYVFDGLELGSECGESKPNFKSHQQYSNDEHTAPSDFQVYVDVNRINQYSPHEADGSYTKPYTDIQLAINKCEELNANPNLNSHCTVKVKRGKYVITKPLQLSASHIHLVGEPDSIVTSDITISNLEWRLYKSSLDTFEGLNPLFEGINPKESTKTVTYIGNFSDVTPCEEYCRHQKNCTSYAYFDATAGSFANQCYARDDGMWNTVSHSGVKSGKKVLIYMTDLTHLPNLQKVDQVFINNRRAIRARFPNANPETMGLHTKPSGYVDNADSWLPPRKTADATELHIQSPVRTATLFPTFYLGMDGPVSQFNPPQSYWGVKNPVGGGGSTYRVPSGLKYSADLEINQRNWANPQTGIIHTFQSLHWGNWMYKLDARDKASRTLSWTWGGFQEARGSNNGREWYVENIFEELDSANEWFFDESTKVLYYSPNGTAADLPIPREISIPQLANLLTISGSQRSPVRNISVTGIHFQHTTQTFLEEYMVPSGGDWSVHPNGVVFVEGSESSSIKRCIFDSPGGNGIFVSDYNRDLHIEENHLFRLGDNGIVQVGGINLIDGTQGNQPRGTVVKKNMVFENGVWGKQTYAYVQSRSCESTLDSNVFFNGPRAGINFNDGFGGGNLINGSLLFNFVRETDDHGPINTWDRVPYLTRVYNEKTISLFVKENNIHYNFLINNYRSVWPIDHDDGSCYWNDTHNFMVYGGYKNYLGHDKRSMHNIYVYPDKHGGKGASMSNPHCLQTAGQTIGTSGYGEVYSHNKCISERSDIYNLGSCTAQHLSLLIPYLSDNQYFTEDGTITANCGGENWNFEEMKRRGMEDGTVVQKLVDDDVVIGWGKENFKL